MNERHRHHVSFASISCTATAGRVITGRCYRRWCSNYTLDDMEADVVRWLQCLRHTVAEESEPWNLFNAVHCGDYSVLDSAIDALFDFDSTTTSVSDFEYYNMSAAEDNGLLTVDGEDYDGRNSVFMMFPDSDISVSFKPKWSDVMAWKNELMDSALDGTSSEDEEQVSVTHLFKN